MAGPHHRGNHPRRAKQVTTAADRDPSTKCWRCGRTQAEHGRRWHAGHLIDGQIDGPLAAECEKCNTSAGAQAGNRRRSKLRPSRDW